MSASGPPAESPSPEVVASISGGGGASSSSSSGAAPASAAGEPVAPQLPAGISSLTDYIGKPEAEAVAALKAANVRRRHTHPLAHHGAFFARGGGAGVRRVCFDADTRKYDAVALLAKMPQMAPRCLRPCTSPRRGTKGLKLLVPLAALTSLFSFAASLQPDFEVTACHFAKLSGIRHGPGSERILRVVYNTDKSVREIKRK